MSQEPQKKKKTFLEKITMLLLMLLGACTISMLFGLFLDPITMLYICAGIMMLLIYPMSVVSRKFKAKRRMLWEQVANELGFEMDPKKWLMRGEYKGVSCIVSKRRIGMGDSPPMYFYISVQYPFPQELEMNTRRKQPHDWFFSTISMDNPHFDINVRVYGKEDSKASIQQYLSEDVQEYILEILSSSQLKFKIHKGFLTGRHLYHRKKRINAEEMRLAIENTAALALLLKEAE